MPQAVYSAFTEGDERVSPPKSSSGRLQRNARIRQAHLSSHSHKQWGKLEEILGGGEIPRSAGQLRFSSPP